MYLLDGVNNGDFTGNAQSATTGYAGAETVKEFQVITNNYSAEYQSKPGAIVSAVTKSGTNEFHGSLFEFLRNDNLDCVQLGSQSQRRDEPRKTGVQAQPVRWFCRRAGYPGQDILLRQL